MGMWKCLGCELSLYYELYVDIALGRSGCWSFHLSVEFRMSNECNEIKAIPNLTSSDGLIMLRVYCMLSHTKYCFLLPNPC
jgi:hypothetical protein